MSRVTLFDRVPISGVKETRDGYLVALPRAGRTGIQIYKGSELMRPDLGDVAVYRPPEEVFHADAMRSLANKPVTLAHPPVPVTPANWSRYAKGHSGEEIVRDGASVRVPLMLADAAAINAFHDGVRELSIGYSTDLQWTPGFTQDGEPYDAVQTKIEANHIALVKRARGGDRLRFGDADGAFCPECGGKMQANDERLTCADCGYSTKGEPMNDADFTEKQRGKLAETGAAMPDGSFPIRNRSDLSNAIHAVGRAKNYDAAKRHIIKRARALGAESDLPADWTKSDTHDGFTPSRYGETKMTAVVIVDGARVEVADELSKAVVEKHISQLHGAAVDLKDKLDKSEADRIEAERKKVTAEDALRSATDSKDGEIAVLRRQLADAQVTPEKLDAMLAERLDVIEKSRPVLGDSFDFKGKNISDMRRAVVAARLGDAAKGMSDEGVNGAFAAIAVGGGSTAHGGSRALADALSHQAASMPTNIADAREKAANERDARLRDAWRTPKTA
jgi:hypothetical protein